MSSGPSMLPHCHYQPPSQLGSFGLPLVAKGCPRQCPKYDLVPCHLAALAQVMKGLEQHLVTMMADAAKFRDEKEIKTALLDDQVRRPHIWWREVA